MRRKDGKEAMLYQVRFVRLKEETALWAEVFGVSLNEKGFLRFGGEGRAATYENFTSLSLPFRNSTSPAMPNASKSCW